MKEPKPDTIRVVLSEDDFRTLIKGDVLNKLNIEIILNGIGYHKMQRIIYEENMET